MEILNDIRIVDLGLYFKKEKTLVISDIHIGYEEALNKQGIMIPRIYFSEQIKKLKKMLSYLDVKKVIINGDLKHEFGKISESEWKNTFRFIDAIGNREIIIIKGNHDKIVKPILEKREIDIKEYEVINNIMICHGDKIIVNFRNKSKKIDTIIIGHEHPAISLRERSRKEIMKCFLKGKYKNKNLIVMPSFNQVTAGSDVLSEKNISPYVSNWNNFEVFGIHGNEILKFGKVKEINKAFKD